MAFSSSNSCTSLVVLLTIMSLWCTACCFEFQVGGSQGWVVPPPNDTNLYNNWASHNRFQLGDSIRFRYKKDSVMEVTEEGYKNCNSSHPKMFSNDGNSVFKLEHEGSLYFISGASGHCHKGQKMIVRVLTTAQEGSDGHDSSDTSPLNSLPKFVFFLLPFVASYYYVV